MHLSRPYSLPTVPLVKHLTFECIAVESNILGRTTGLSGPVYGDAPHVVSLCQGLRVKNARRMRLLQAEPCSEDQGWPYLQRYLAWDVEEGRQRLWEPHTSAAPARSAGRLGSRVEANHKRSFFCLASIVVSDD